MGAIPDEIQFLNGLELLDLKHNEISGTIPEAIGRLGLLGYLDLKDNRLTGTIPDFSPFLSGLEVLGLGRNYLEGTVPESLGRQPLQTLAIDDNVLTGELFLSLGSIPSLKYLYAGNNNFVENLDDRILSGFPKMEELDLSENSFTAQTRLPPPWVADRRSRVLRAGRPEKLRTRV